MIDTPAWLDAGSCCVFEHFSCLPGWGRSLDSAPAEDVLVSPMPSCSLGLLTSAYQSSLLDSASKSWPPWLANSMLQPRIALVEGALTRLARAGPEDWSSVISRAMSLFSGSSG